MPTPPQQTTDPFEAANLLTQGVRVENLPGFNAPIPPGQSGGTVRQGSIDLARASGDRNAFFVRNMVRWFVPEVGIVEMYVNPQSIDYRDKKHISNQRTKGGYVLQYWGEELSQLNIQGTTGSSGIEGVNVLRDIYRAEQLAFDPYALSLAANRAEANAQTNLFGGTQGGSFLDGLGEAGADFLDLVFNAAQTGSVESTRAKPTLASLAFSVEMYYSGWVFRGYFTDFTIQERADRLGLFDYNMTFMVTQRRGIRQNFLGWHRSATNGPSNSDPNFGTPYTFNGFGTEQPAAPRVQTQNNGLSLLDSLSDAASLVLSPVTTVVDTVSSIF